MVFIVLVIIGGLFLSFAVWQYALAPELGKTKKTDGAVVFLWIMLVIGLIVRLICANVFSGHSTDMSSYLYWSIHAFEDGLKSIYTESSFAYPPGYIYILYITGAIRHLFSMGDAAFSVLVRTPPMIADILTGLLVYKVVSKKLSSSASLIIAALYVFNPAVITDSALWGQADSVYTLFIAITLWFIAEKQPARSYFAFALCILMKPQAFIYTPLIIYSIIENYIYPEFRPKELVKNIAVGLSAIAMMVLISVPFNLALVISQYTNSFDAFEYFTINAFNFWGMLGFNWKALNAAGNVIGTIVLVLIVAFTTYVFFKSKNKSKYYIAAAILALLTFMLSTKMHERYAFPAMIFILLAFAESRSVHNYALYTLTSLSQFFNIAWILFIYEKDINYYFRSPVVTVASIINVLIMIYFLYVTAVLYPRGKISAFSDTDNSNKSKRFSAASKNARKSVKPAVFAPAKTKLLDKVTRADIIAMAVITVVYSAVALYDLGDMYAPQTHVSLTDNPVTVDLGSNTQISRIRFYLGSERIYEEHPLILDFKDSSGNITHTEKYTSGAVFRWEEHNNINTSARFITLSTEGTDRMEINELALYDANGSLITPANASEQSAAAMFDEQEMIPERQTFRNSTYFDEIYHARTAYEFVHGLPVYEWTHPPLGKVFIALGILIFGMCPFGWRIVGTLFGIIMVPIIYMFAKRFFNKTWLAIVTCLLFTFDFMHFAQTRIATIDVYVTFFIMLMYLFMYKYTTMSFYDTPLKKTFVPLALSGISFGLAVACKWTGLYAGAGLAIIFFLTVYQRYSEYIKAQKRPKEYKDLIEAFTPNLIKTLGWCCIFFVAVPLAIYCLSYIPYLHSTCISGGGNSILENLRAMYVYHSSTVLGSTHAYSSRWYEWIIMKRPIWYYSGTVSNSVKEGISAFGNPLVWWLGIPAFFYMLYAAIAKKDKRALFLVIAYLSQLVPWIPITRLTFIYHYFPCVPFIVMMLGYSIYLIYEEAKDKDKKKVIYGAFVYTALVIALFVMFYPVLSGQPCPVDYANHFLKWFKSWVLI